MTESVKQHVIALFKKHEMEFPELSQDGLSVESYLDSEIGQLMAIDLLEKSISRVIEKEDALRAQKALLVQRSELSGRGTITPPGKVEALINLDNQLLRIKLSKAKAKLVVFSGIIDNWKSRYKIEHDLVEDLKARQTNCGCKELLETKGDY